MSAVSTIATRDGVLLVEPFVPLFAAEIRTRRVDQRCYSSWRRHLDEIFVRINGEKRYLWRAVDHEGEVLDGFVTKQRDRKAALKFLKRTINRFGRSRSTVTDRLRSYRSAMKDIGNADRQETGRWLNNRAENSLRPLRRRERAMVRFRSPATLQKFAAVHVSLHNLFHPECHLYKRRHFKANGTAALAGWRKRGAV